MSLPAPPLQHLIVTRPAAEATVWVNALKAQGWPAVALPLIHIAEPRDPAAAQALHHARAHWTEMDAIMFVSGAAVNHFFAHGIVVAPPTAGLRTRFWAPGPGTARALSEALGRLGVSPDRIDAPAADAAQFDSESLWPVVASQARMGHRILVVRGSSGEPGQGELASPLAGQGRDWLIHQCEAGGAQVRTCVAYERSAPAWTSEARALALQCRGAASAWIFSSSEALEHLLALEAGADWSRASALATHPRIASRVREAGFGRVLPARPALPDVLSALESVWIRP